MGVLDLNKSTAGVSHSVNYMHQPLHNHLIRLIRKRFPNGCRVLDVGCGTGAMVQSLLDLGFDAYGTDALTRGKLTEELVQQGRISVGDFFEFEHDLKPFDLIVIAEVLEHIATMWDSSRKRTTC